MKSSKLWELQQKYNVSIYPTITFIEGPGRPGRRYWGASSNQGEATRVAAARLTSPRLAMYDWVETYEAHELREEVEVAAP